MGYQKRIREPQRLREHGTLVFKPSNAEERITAIRRIVDNKQYAKIDGCMIDLFSASAIVKVWDNLSEGNQVKFCNMLAPVMATIAFKLLK